MKHLRAVPVKASLIGIWIIILTVFTMPGVQMVQAAPGDTIDQFENFWSYSTIELAYDNETIACLPAGGSLEYTVTLAVGPDYGAEGGMGATLVNSASVSGDEFDPDMTNNSANDVRTRPEGMALPAVMLLLLED